MRLVYMDEAGLSDPAKEPFVVVAGLIVNADQQLLIVEKYIQAIVEKYIPEEARSSFVFHAYELFGGIGFFEDRDRWPLPLRLHIADELSEIPAKLNVPFTLGFIERQAGVLNETVFLPEDPSTHDITVLAHVVAHIHCSMRVEAWMRENTSNEVCLLVVENNDNARRLIEGAQRYLQGPNVLDKWEPAASKYFPFSKIREKPLFDVKTPNSVLQLADYCAYVFKRLLMKDDRYHRFYDPMSSSLAVIDESEKVR